MMSSSAASPSPGRSIGSLHKDFDFAPHTTARAARAACLVCAVWVCVEVLSHVSLRRDCQREMMLDEELPLLRVAVARGTYYHAGFHAIPISFDRR